MFLVLRGSVTVTLSHESGRSEEVATLGPGSFFGEMSLLTGENRSPSVTAAGEVECGELDKETVAELFLYRPELLREISSILEHRQTELECVRVTLQKNAEPSRRPDLRTRMQQFFGLGKIATTSEREASAEAKTA